MVKKAQKEKIYLGLVGEGGSGKDTVAKFLEKRFGAEILTSSYLLKRSLRVFLDDFSREDYTWYVKILTKKYGEDIISKAMIRSMRQSKKEIVVFNGVRLPSDYELLRKEGATLIYVTADSRLRWKRISGRGEKTDDSAPYDKFMAMHTTKTEVNVPKIGKKADFKIENDGTLEDLESKTVEVIEKIMAKK